MDDVAHAADCSRGTVYRYFKNRHELRLAYIDRETLRIGSQIQKRIRILLIPQRCSLVL